MPAATDRRRLLIAGLAFLGCVAIAALFLANPHEIPTTPREEPRRTVRALTVSAGEVVLVIRSQGTVAPRSESRLVVEISGRIVWMAPALAAGGFFAQGEPLVRIDAADYEDAVRSARAALVRARAEHEQAAQELGRRESLKGSEVVSVEQLGDARRAERVAWANLEEARVALGGAERNLTRTELRAPFAGRVREKVVDVGQFVERGMALATLYAIDRAEVRLPVPDAELAYLDWPEGRVDLPEGSQPPVVLRAAFGGAAREWRGRIVRTEGAIDPRTRMVNVIAEVEDPYGLGETSREVPLTVGLFVQAEIRGRTESAIVRLPRAALHTERSVLVVGPEDRLAERSVDVLRITGDEVLVRGGLRSGERVCISSVPLFVEGMRVQVAPAEPS